MSKDGVCNGEAGGGGPSDAQDLLQMLQMQLTSQVGFSLCDYLFKQFHNPWLLTVFNFK